MPRPSNYQKMSLKALIAEREKISAAIVSGARSSVAVKFRNPKNPSETWSGRGRPARWLTRETNGDKRKFDKFLVK
jgi:DNA-binding protein H-NS